MVDLWFALSFLKLGVELSAVILLCVCVCVYVCVAPGSEASFRVDVKQLERYPVDLYYLVDVSASMQENLDHVGVHM